MLTSQLNYLMRDSAVMLWLVLMWADRPMSLLLTQHVRRGRARADRTGLGSLGWGRAVDHRHHPCSAPEGGPQRAAPCFTFAPLTEWVMWWSTCSLLVLFLPTKPCCLWRCHQSQINWVGKKKSVILKIWIWNQLESINWINPQVTLTLWLQSPSLRPYIYCIYIYIYIYIYIDT